MGYKRRGKRGVKRLSKEERKKRRIAKIMEFSKKHFMQQLDEYLKTKNTAL